MASGSVTYSKSRYINFKCLRVFLASANLFFLVMGLIIVTLPVYFHVNKLLKSWPINGGIIAMGALLFFLALLGCYGSIRQHQIILFFYMVLLAIICIITFCFALAVLYLTKPQQENVLHRGWMSLSRDTKNDFQIDGNCCGFKNISAISHPPCNNLPCFSAEDGCQPCFSILQNDWFISFRRAIGGFALFVSLLMILSVYFTARFRHIRNPRSNPNNYL